MRTLLLSLALSTSVLATETTRFTTVSPPTRPVDLVIALDTSGSMSGLINSARQRLWDIVNELGQAQPTPELRVAIISFGNPGHGADSGYVRIDQPFTSNLDEVNRTLFAYTTNGGEEYVARAIHRAVEGLQWNRDKDGLRMIFVAGNESANQDPVFSIQSAARAANELDIVINTIFCGAETDALAMEWSVAAQLAGGFFASIDQNAAAVAQVSTPYDDELLRLNDELNRTFVAYGPRGDSARANLGVQDANAAAMSAPAAASRVVTKAGKLYDSADWDLVGAMEAGRDLKEIEEEALPEELKKLDSQQREVYLQEQVAARARLKQEIASLDADRRSFLDQQANESDDGLDTVIARGVRKAALARGFTFSKETSRK